MATKKMGLAIIRDKNTGLAELSTQIFASKRDVRERYPKEKYKLLAYPVKFDSNGFFDFDPESDADIGD